MLPLADVMRTSHHAEPLDMHCAGEDLVARKRCIDISRQVQALQIAVCEECEQCVTGVQENTMVQFRGDALHSIDNFQSAKGLPRASLVLKQYRLSPGDYAFAPEFVVGAW